MNYPQGSEWRKWDLHVHTPASLIHNYPGNETDAWTAFLADLEQLPPEVKVIGINDYLFLDGYKRVVAERAGGRLQNLDLILPVIELRLDKFAGHESHFKRVNYHVIFDAIDPEIIETQFINLLNREFKLLPINESLSGRWSAVPTRKTLTDLGQMIIDAAPVERKAQYGSPLSEGFNNFNATLDNVQKALGSTYFEGRYLTAVGKTEWDDVRWSDASIAEKRTIINHVDIVFTAAESAAAFHKARTALAEANVNRKLLDCSDAHELSTSAIKDRVGNCFSWIKADTTFAGLQHAIKEYDKRVFVGDVPDKMMRVRSNPTKYIERIGFKKKASSTLAEPWFSTTFPLNKDLVAIIGNKGSGKSALADTIALLGDTKRDAHFAFLTEAKFRDPRENKASHFEATLTWKSDTTATKSLDADSDKNAVESIKYLPQNYIENLCNEIASGEDSDFDRELKQIIFSHLDPADRLGLDSLDDVVRFLSSETQRSIRALVEHTHVINDRIVQLEERGTSSYKAKLQSQLKAKEDELQAHERSKPESVPEPNQSETLQASSLRIKEEISARRADARAAEEAIATLVAKRATLTRRVAAFDRTLGKLDGLSSFWEAFQRGIAADLSELGLEPPLTVDDIAKLQVDRERLMSARIDVASELSTVIAVLDTPKDDDPPRRLTIALERLTYLEHSLDEPNRKFVAYQNAVDSWTKSRILLVGDIHTPNSVEWFLQRLVDLDEVPIQLADLRRQRVERVTAIYREIRKLTEAYGRLYQPVQDFVEHQTSSDLPIPLTFRVTIAEDGFAEQFLERINRQVRGSFSGVEESGVLVRRKLQSVDFDNEESVLAFLQEIDESLHLDRRPGASGDTPLEVTDQLRKGETPLALYDYLFSLVFLKPRYSLQYGGREIRHLSPGERGLLLLVFYLLIDKDDIPLVIDQPEENLDNQTIYEVLVRCINEAKTRRQVVIVTHNPNLAVVCDAEQVIYAERDRATNAIVYHSGGIENPAINRRIINVLEGTRPAFDNRDSKYFA